MRHMLCAFAVFLFSSALAQFPEYKDLPKNVVFPKNAKVALSETGEYMVNGKPRFLLGIQIAERAQAYGFAPTPGYPPELKWIYEQPLVYESAQRIGFDTFAYFIDASPWLRQYAGDGMKAWGMSPNNIVFRDAFLSNNLPLLVDTTCFPWTFGHVAANKKLREKHLPDDAVNAFVNGSNNHWVPYNIIHPQGRSMYLSYWNFVCDKYLKEVTNQPVIFELFNEPAYDDPSDYNRKQFKRYLQEKYKTLDELNRTWNTQFDSFDTVVAFKHRYDCLPLNVDWTLFLEGAMTKLAIDGRDLVHKKMPGALVTYQILGNAGYRLLQRSNINIFEINRHMDAISTPTGGGIVHTTGLAMPPEHTVEMPSNQPGIAEGLLQRHFLRTTADNKPIHNPECYAGKSRHSKYLVTWLDFLRGSNITYFFTWGKRAWEWNPKNTPEGGKHIADRMPYTLGNPYAHEPHTLPGFMDAKKEIVELSDFFLPRKNRASAETALLLSFPTHRLLGTTDYSDYNEIQNAASALEFSHFPYDVIPEEYLVAPRKNYKAICAVGVRNTLDSTLPKLDEYVRNGGLFIAVRQPLPQDQYGKTRPQNPLFDGLTLTPLETGKLQELQFKAPFKQYDLLPGRVMAKTTHTLAATASWNVLATCDGKPAIVQRPHGKGCVIFIAPSFQDNAIAAVLASLLQQHDIQPSTKLTRHLQKDLEPNVEIHTVKHDALSAFSLINLDLYPKLSDFTLPAGHDAAFDLRSKTFLEVKQGRITLCFGSNDHRILATGKQSDLLARFGKHPVADAPTKQYDALWKQHLAERSKINNAEFTYDIDEANTSTIDLRNIANANFTDTATPTDWLGQGNKESLANVPWEVMKLDGVPCDFIRFDANDSKACIVLNSTSSPLKRPNIVKSIPINADVRSLFFFHGVGNPVPNTKAFSYVVHFQNGKHIEIPVICGENIDNWKLEDATLRPVWKNRANRGFFMDCWRNPYPMDTVTSLDIVSANGKSIPFVVGITVEKRPQALEIYPVPMKRISPWGTIDLTNQRGTVTVAISEKTADWAGTHYWLETPVTLMRDQMNEGHVVMEVNGGNDRFGNHMGGQRLQLSAAGRYQRLNLGIDTNPNTFQTFKIPLKLWSSKSKAPSFLIEKVSLQFTGTGKSSGYQVRNIRIEVPARKGVTRNMRINYSKPEDLKLADMLPFLQTLDESVDVDKLDYLPNVTSQVLTSPNETFAFLHEAAIISFKGTLFASWYNCPINELKDFTPIRGTRSKDGGKIWTEIETLGQDKTGKLLYCPPVYAIDNDRLFLYMNTMVGPDLIHSFETYLFDEKTEKFNLISSEPLPFKLNTNAVRLSNGKLMLPGRLAKLDSFPNTPAVLISDSGKGEGPWRVVKIAPNGNMPDGSKLVHPELTAIIQGSRVIMFSRDDERSVPLLYISEDNCETWSGPYEHNIPFSNSKIYAGTLSDGRNYIVGNLHPGRNKLAIFFTKPNSLIFDQGGFLRNGPAPELKAVPQFSYPACYEADGKLYVIYTMQQRVEKLSINGRGAMLSIIDLK